MPQFFFWFRMYSSFCGFSGLMSSVSCSTYFLCQRSWCGYGSSHLKISQNELALPRISKLYFLLRKFNWLYRHVNLSRVIFFQNVSYSVHCTFILGWVINNFCFSRINFSQSVYSPLSRITFCHSFRSLLIPLK